jgi:uncharacterized protein YggT (Ycf19 family)
MSIVVELVYLALALYAWLIVARALLSWVRLRPGTPFYRLDKALVAVTEPYIGLFRRFLPVTRIGGVGIDWSALVALLVLLAVLRLLGRFQ